MKLIEKSIRINATTDKVWRVLTEDNFNRQWFSEFSPGTYAETDWKVGSKAIFKDNSLSGIVAHVEKNEPGKELVLEYDGVLDKGAEDFESDMAKSVKGQRECYFLKESADGVVLDITCDMSPEYYDQMSASWDKALQKVKDLSEAEM